MPYLLLLLLLLLSYLQRVLGYKEKICTNLTATTTTNHCCHLQHANYCLSAGFCFCWPKCHHIVALLTVGQLLVIMSIQLIFAKGFFLFNLQCFVSFFCVSKVNEWLAHVQLASNRKMQKRARTQWLFAHKEMYIFMKFLCCSCIFQNFPLQCFQIKYRSY